MSGTGTRIASISGLRGVVGDGLDPATVVEFAAAYASVCEAGPIVVGHDGRVSAPVFMAAVEAGVSPRPAMMSCWSGRRPRRRSAWLVRDHGRPAGFRSRRRTIPPRYNGLKFFQRGGMVLSRRRGGPARPLASAAIFAGRAGMAWAGRAGSTIPMRRT